MILSRSTVFEETLGLYVVNCSFALRLEAFGCVTKQPSCSFVSGGKKLIQHGSGVTELTFCTN